jgi:hypothetical protein
LLWAYYCALYSAGRLSTPLALAQKKSIALQAVRQSTVGILPRSSGSYTRATMARTEQVILVTAMVSSMTMTSVEATTQIELPVAQVVVFAVKQMGKEQTEVDVSTTPMADVA